MYPQKVESEPHSDAPEVAAPAVVALKLDHVTKVFPGVKALDDVELTVYAGEVHGIVGENGAGKSTLMAVASGAIVPEAGAVSIHGDTLRAGSTHAAQQHGIAIVRQEPALLPDLSVAENLYLGVTADRRPAPSQMRVWARQQLAAWSPDTGIDPDARVEELTAEQRFIIDIVRSLAMQPTVLVLDEPTEHLAREDVDRLFEAVRERIRDGGAVIYISHRIREVKQIADRITVLCDGQSRGTFAAGELSEQDIVDLIVGRKLEAVFPDKVRGEHSDTPVLTVEGLTGRGFDDVSFSVRPGEIIGFAGIEGNGQHEALRSMAGITRHTGTMAIDGRALRGQTADGIAYLTGDRHREGVFPTLSVRETITLRNLREVTALGAVLPWAERELSAKTIADLNVKTPTIDTPMESLSGGNQQKVLLGAVLARDPRVMLIDEPTQGVDIGAKAEIYRLLRTRARQTGIGIVVASSDALELAGLCDRVLIFSRGQVARRLSGEDVTETRITEAILTATTHRSSDARRDSGVVRWLSGDVAPLVMVSLAILLLGIYTATQSAFYLQDVNVNGTLALAATLGFVAIGQTITLMAGAIDLSVGPLMGFVVVVQSFFLTASAGVGDAALGAVLFVVVPLAVGLVNWSLVDLVKLNSIVATLITFIALQALSLVLRPEPGGSFSTDLAETISTSVGPIPVAFIVLVIVSVAMTGVLKRARAGIALRAVGSHPGNSRLNGLSPARLRLAAFLLCSLFAGIAALLLLAQVGSGDPTAGVNYTLISISAAVIGGASIFGGRGSFVATVAGALLVTQSIGAIQFLNLDTAWASYLPGAMTLVAVAVYSKSRQIAVRAR